MPTNHPDRRKVLQGGLAAALGAAVFPATDGLAAAPQRAGAASSAASCECEHGADGTLFDIGASELRPMIERYEADLEDYDRVYSQEGSATRLAKFKMFYEQQLHLLDSVKFDALSQSGRVDYVLFRNHIQHSQKQLAKDDTENQEIAPLVPYQAAIMDL